MEPCDAAHVSAVATSLCADAATAERFLDHEADHLRRRLLERNLRAAHLDPADNISVEFSDEHYSDVVNVAHVAELGGQVRVRAAVAIRDGVGSPLS